MPEDTKPFSKEDRKYLGKFFIAGSFFVLYMVCVIVSKTVAGKPPTRP